ncbi:hypothetical protein TWF696_006584 [Orbilia brochopaga]|uniref:Uncharacterized protein n=1 Tax=Orbilia brochopaga TaxID=3140254 RepID=A0AAV9UWV8_9PEZI
MASTSTRSNTRLGILAIGVAVIAASGALAGAVYRTDSQKQQTAQQFRQESTADKIARLQKTRKVLVARRNEIASKIEGLEIHQQ